MALSVWKTACGATFIFSRSTMILVEMTRDKRRQSPPVLRRTCMTIATDLKTSWSTVIPAACVSSNNSASSAVRIFFFLMAYF